MSEPRLLIGGLAVQQYVSFRQSVDIDLVIDFSTSQQLIESLYPTKDWIITDHNDDEYRPSYRIKPRTPLAGLDTIIFGPKIIEREPYNFIDWNKLADGATPFRHKNSLVHNIGVPRPEALAFSKIISFIGRPASNHEKQDRDFSDFIELMNLPAFDFSLLHSLFYDSRINEQISIDLQLDSNHVDKIENSIPLSLIKDLFGPYITIGAQSEAGGSPSGVANADEAGASKNRSFSTAPQESAIIVVVDDELPIHELCKQVAGRFGATIVPLQSSQELTDYLLTLREMNSAFPRLFLLDQIMSDDEDAGVKNLKQIRKSNERVRNTPVVLFSMWRNSNSIYQAYQNFANAYYEKPSSVADFEACLERIFDFWLSSVPVPIPLTKRDP